MNLDGVVERPPESGDTFKEGVFIFLGWFSLGSDSQAQSEENRRNLIGEEISLNSMSARGNRARKRGKRGRVCVSFPKNKKSTNYQGRNAIGAL